MAWRVVSLSVLHCRQSGRRLPGLADDKPGLALCEKDFVMDPTTDAFNGLSWVPGNVS
jgi:hypothetical protein